MKTELNRYIQNLKMSLCLEPNREKDVIRELEAHVEDECRELQNEGLTEKEALEKCLRLLGPAKLVAHQFYEVHSQGTWRQALLAAMPHLFFALLFVLRWLGGAIWLPVMFAAVLAIGLYGWYHGKPTWLFPWLSYSLLPVAAAGVSLLYLPSGLAWIALLLYIPLGVWLSCFITIKFMRRDWVYSALMLLPIPTFVGWFLVTKQETTFPSFKINFLYDSAPWTGLTFLILALAVALIIRVKQRWFRITALIISGLVAPMVVILPSAHVGIISSIILVLLVVSLLLAPVFVERKVKERTNT
ncbi:MAG: hypothetical protein JW856_05730 [Dehalococcoidales bacterium]|nr:hypothetical protein [Dehalococcoidales bacterium]